MRRSAFLWITGLAAAAWGAIVYVRPMPREDVARNENPAPRVCAEPGLAGRAGRCVAARKTTRWSGYTSDDVIS